MKNGFLAGKSLVAMEADALEKENNDACFVFQPGEREGYFVYILQCADLTLYTGIAKDVPARIAVHNRGKGAKYTRGRLPVQMVYQESCADKSAALRRELAIKGLKRADKLQLIIEFNKARDTGENNAAP